MGILFASSDWRISKTRALLKLFFYQILYPNLKVIKPSVTSKYIVCPLSSYEGKKYFYEEIARHLNAGIICLQYSFSKSDMKDYKELELVYWSGKRLSAMLSAKRFGIPINSVFQHGFFTFSDGMDSILLELRGLDVKRYYIFKENLNLAASKFSNINFIEIIQPTQPRREVVESNGFATRGPEFFIRDILLVTNSRHVFELVYFHPNYSKLKKLLFIFITTSLGGKISSGTGDSISRFILTRSNSFKKLALEHGVQVE